MDLAPLLIYINKITPLTTEEGEKIAARFKIRKYLKGQFVVQNGDVCKYENFVLKGCLRQFYIDNEGFEHIIMFAIEDWWAGDLGSMVNHTPSDFNIQCVENCELAQIHFEDLQILYEEVPKLERLFRIIIQRAFIASQKRIINNFSLSAKERYLQFRQTYPLIEQRVPQYMIASYLGITKEFLSKIRNQLIME